MKKYFSMNISLMLYTSLQNVYLRKYHTEDFKKVQVQERSQIKKCTCLVLIFIYKMFLDDCYH